VGRWVNTVNNPQITTTYTVNTTNTFTPAFNNTNHSPRAPGLVSQTVASSGPADPLVPTILVWSTGLQEGVPQGVEIRSSNPIINASNGTQSQNNPNPNGVGIHYSHPQLHHISSHILIVQNPVTVASTQYMHPPMVAVPNVRPLVIGRIPVSDEHTFVQHSAAPAVCQPTWSRYVGPNMDQFIQTTAPSAGSANDVVHSSGMVGIDPGVTSIQNVQSAGACPFKSLTCPAGTERLNNVCPFVSLKSPAGIERLNKETPEAALIPKPSVPDQATTTGSFQVIVQNSQATELRTETPQIFHSCSNHSSSNPESTTKTWDRVGAIKMLGFLAQTNLS
jgi:hypothetical protein